MLGDVAQRGTGAIVEGTLGGANQLARELGASRTTANQLERDLRLLSLAGGMSAGLNPAAVSGAAGRAPALARESAAAGRRSAASSGIAMRARMFQQEVREAERRQERRVGRQAMRDLGRPRIPQTSTVGEFKRVIGNVLDTGLRSRGTVFRGDLGPITIDVGRPGRVVERRGKRGRVFQDIEGGSGLSKIIQKRNLDKLDGKAFARDILPEVLSKGRLVGFRDIDNVDRRAIIEHKNNRAILALVRFKDGDTIKETWILTAFRRGRKTRKRGRPR